MVRKAESRRVELRVPHALYEQIAASASKQERSVNGHIVWLLSEQLDKETPKRKDGHHGSPA